MIEVLERESNVLNDVPSTYMSYFPERFVYVSFEIVLN